jgi:hypothetical protein
METPGVRQRIPYDRADAVAAAWERYYKASRKGKSWKGCVVCPPERRDPNAQTEVHHPIEQQRLKTYAKDKGIGYLRLLRLLTDDRNSMLVCQTCHHGHTSGMNPLPRRALSQPAWDFAAELGLTDELMEGYAA